VNEKNNTAEPEVKKVIYENIEEWVREKVQNYLQEILEEEVTEFLGRKKHERKVDEEKIVGYRNGYGKERKFSMQNGTITLKRPRLREVEEKFESAMMPLYAKRTKQITELLPELYLQGLAAGDFEIALRGVLGSAAPLSESSIARLKAKWQSEYESWKLQPLEQVEVVYLWVDGVYVKAGLEKDKACLLVALAGLSDGRKVFLTIEAGVRESTQSWAAMLRKLKDRGLKAPKLVIGDGHLGIWAGLKNIYPEAKEQRCWNHRLVNILDRVQKKDLEQAQIMVKKIPYAETLKQAEKLKLEFQAWAKQKGYMEAALLIDTDWDRMTAFYQFPKSHWKHLRTTNPIESVFSSVRLRTDAAKRFKKVDNATALIWKILLLAEKTFHKLNSPKLLKDVFNGVSFNDGLPLTSNSTTNLEHAA
jgi:transposase-like protein